MRDPNHPEQPVVTPGEPDWLSLPLETVAADWRAFMVMPGAQDIIAFLANGQVHPASCVWLHGQAVTAFAAACDVEEGEAFIELGSGLLRYWQAVPTVGRHGGVTSVQFRGAVGLEFYVLGWDDRLFLYRPDDLADRAGAVRTTPAPRN